MRLIDIAREWPRPLLMWLCLPLLAAAIFFPFIETEKLVVLSGLIAALYGFRAWEKVEGAE